MHGIALALILMPAIGGEIVVDRGVRVPAVGRAAMAFDGENFLVVWEQPSDYLAERLVATRVGLDGTLLDDPAIDLAPSAQAADRQDRRVCERAVRRGLARVPVRRLLDGQPSW